MTVSRIEATGSEVVLQAPSVQAAARGELLQYDFQSRRVLLQDLAEGFICLPRTRGRSTAIGVRTARGLQATGQAVGHRPGRLSRCVRQEDVQRPLAGCLGRAPWNCSRRTICTSCQWLKARSLTWGEMGKFSADKLFIWLAEVETPVAETPCRDARCRSPVPSPVPSRSPALASLLQAWGPASVPTPAALCSDQPPQPLASPGEENKNRGPARQNDGAGQRACRLRTAQRPRYQPAGSLVRPPGPRARYPRGRRPG